MGHQHADFWQHFWLNPKSALIADGEPVAGIRKDDVPVPLEVSLNVVDTPDSRYVVASIADINERLNLEGRLSSATQQNLGFQRLVADIAARFATVKPDAVDATIAETLREVAEALDLDRAILWRYTTGEATGIATHYWMADAQPSPPPPYLAAAIAVDVLADRRRRSVLLHESR